MHWIDNKIYKYSSFTTSAVHVTTALQKQQTAVVLENKNKPRQTVMIYVVQNAANIINVMQLPNCMAKVTRFLRGYSHQNRTHSMYLQCSDTADWASGRPAFPKCFFGSFDIGWWQKGIQPVKI